jgi:hypothetical protein
MIPRVRKCSEVIHHWNLFTSTALESSFTTNGLSEHAIKLQSSRAMVNAYLDFDSLVSYLPGPYQFKPKPFIDRNIRFQNRCNQITPRPIPIRLTSQLNV